TFFRSAAEDPPALQRHKAADPAETVIAASARRGQSLVTETDQAEPSGFCWLVRSAREEHEAKKAPNQRDNVADWHCELRYMRRRACIASREEKDRSAQNNHGTG